MNSNKRNKSVLCPIIPFHRKKNTRRQVEQASKLKEKFNQLFIWHIVNQQPQSNISHSRELTRYNLITIFSNSIQSSIPINTTMTNRSFDVK
ncbi:hypothetical protein GLOIN_2v1585942 [Rhizophagus irregularis DAOM 181602=DAOM 197198]|uniref:Uncharacterized protein n=1 Tax=Rhizophagus irregularis (strain DAOM 181602 / DAOM 197198 / MUCL 43194) TaxID=747089 RepID=A0A2P4Q7F7_RHIID|nr:hypothetical protein GLOIN_2v1585942 [Rhizophagus irregularis DAOM 181602=DAOM 197198]POG73574.1 hypothetical protein GLOIN_2v1585942 [Rhizophagus irregularis DAOM 181602=DAOM 197198]GET52184.1 hypothetical protein GLOIN_2v1585942 [Rhizophagus irregularis DAOM 181602=DAOM 197198]|eukprot:XP_025180440.1 hypothetical protein GLOIN_2v1585942 [Rhizophagus irregularis DAOM 181602=DAOM 197198]